MKQMMFHVGSVRIATPRRGNLRRLADLERIWTFDAISKHALRVQNSEFVTL
jgi:hypothetical protein